MARGFNIPTWIEEKIQDGKRRQPGKKVRKKEKNKAAYSSKEEEYQNQKPCCRSNGKIGH